MRWNSSSGRNTTSELMQKLVHKLNGAYVLLAGTLLLRASLAVPVAWKKPLTNQLKDQNTPSLIQSWIWVKWSCQMIPAGWRWSLWNWVNREISLVFELCGSDSLIVREGELGVIHLFFGVGYLLFCQPCIFIWWQWHQHGAVAGAMMRISWYWFFRCCTACFYICVIALSGCRFCEGHPGISGLICIYVLEVIISRGYWCLGLFMCMCSCLPGWHSRTSGRTPLPWRITGSGRSRVSAWQRSRGLRITAEIGGVWKCPCVRVNMSVCVHESSEETADPSSHTANHFCDPPKTVLCLMPSTDSAAVSTVQLGGWQCPFGVVWKREGGNREGL